MCMARLVPEVSLQDSLKQCHIGFVLRELDVEPGSDFHVVFYLTLLTCFLVLLQFSLLVGYLLLGC